ncbi:MAG: MAPEG family protein [Colwellia sp.]|nr:MAPEG family protein [Colwellia sp.]MCW9080180.1 MAPEG family protein [Colwellia sp.]
MDINITITAFYASLLALLFLALSFNVIRLRLKLKVGVGDGGEKALTKAIRIHGNFAEYMPLALILLAGYELSGADSLWLHLLGSVLFIGRVLHALGLSQSIGTSKPRVIGTLSMFIVLLILAIANICAFIC